MMRTLLKLLMLSFSLNAFAGMDGDEVTNVPSPEKPVKKVVYDVSTGKVSDAERLFNRIIPNLKDYYASQGEALEIAVVIHGQAYKFVTKDLDNSPFKDDEEIHAFQLGLGKQLSVLHKDLGVEFAVCGVGLERQKMTAKMLYSFISVAPSSTIALINLQNAGYAYMPYK